MSETPERTAADARRAQLVVSQLPSGAVAVIPTDFDQVWRLAGMFAASGEMVPKTYRDNPNACAMAILWGMELGITPVQSIQGIAVIGGKPSVWGDLLMALCQASPKFVDLLEIELRAEDGAYIGARAIAKRNGREDVVRDFTLKMAQDSGLTLKSNTPWQVSGYQPRMCQMRARSWALRDQFADALRGIASADEMRDVIDGESVEVVRERKPAQQPREQVPMPTARAAPVDALPAPEQNSLAELDSLLLRQREHVPVEGGAPADAAKEPQAAGIGGDFSKLTAGQRAAFDALCEAKGVSENDFVDGFGDFVHGANYHSAMSWLEARP